MNREFDENVFIEDDKFGRLEMTQGHNFYGFVEIDDIEAELFLEIYDFDKDNLEKYGDIVAGIVDFTRENLSQIIDMVSREYIDDVNSMLDDGKEFSLSELKEILILEKIYIDEERDYTLYFSFDNFAIEQSAKVEGNMYTSIQEVYLE